MTKLFRWQKFIQDKIPSMVLKNKMKPLHSQNSTEFVKEFSTKISFSQNSLERKWNELSKLNYKCIYIYNQCILYTHEYTCACVHVLCIHRILIEGIHIYVAGIVLDSKNIAIVAFFSCKMKWILWALNYISTDCVKSCL